MTTPCRDPTQRIGPAGATRAGPDFGGDCQRSAAAQSRLLRPAGRRRRFVAPRRRFPSSRRSRAAGRLRRDAPSRHGERSRGASRRAARSRARGFAPGSARPGRPRAAPARRARRRAASDVGQRRRRLDVEDRLDPRLGLLRVLAARARSSARPAARSRTAAGDGARDPNSLRHGTRASRWSPPRAYGLIDSRSMACILLDVDGVLHVSGEPIPARREAVDALRDAGHSLRFVTNNSTRPRARSPRSCAGSASSSTTTSCRRRRAPPRASSRASACSRSSMAAVVPDLDGARARRRRRRRGPHRRLRRDARAEPGLQLHEPRARVRRDPGWAPTLYCLHKNRWWQTSRGPLLDAGAFVAGLEYATGVEATVLGKPSPPYFAAALDALDAEPELTWLVDDDVEADVRGAQLFGMRTALVRTGQVPARDARDGRRRRRTSSSRSLAQLPDWLERGSHRRHRRVKVGIDLIEIERIRRALERPGFRERVLHAGRAGVLRLAAQPGRELRGALRGQGGGRQGARLRRPLHLEGDRDRRPAEAGRARSPGRTAAFAERVGAARSTSR